MHTLTMPGELRERFSALGLLAINASGQEVLLGLHFEESQFFIGCLCKAQGAWSPEDRERYADLLGRHERARLQMASTADAVPRNEDRLG